MDISIVIPMHNEEEALEDLLPALDKAYGDFAPALTFEVVLMDDGSTDRSFEKAYTWAERARFPVKVLRLNPREGIGGAIRSSFDFCIGESVVTYDADMSYPLDDIRKLVAARRAGADIVTASPYGSEGRVGDVAGNRLGISRLATTAYRWRLGKKAGNLTCFTCGFRAYDRGILPAISNRHDGFLATAELLVNGIRRGYRVEEVPSTLSPRVKGHSKMKVFRTAISHLVFLIRCR